MFGRTLKDALPNLPANLRYRAETTNFRKKYGEPASKYWKYTLEGRELGASRKLAKSKERYDEHASPLASLSVEDCVSIQNREGNKPLKWRTGSIWSSAMGQGESCSGPGAISGKFSQVPGTEGGTTLTHRCSRGRMKTMCPCLYTRG